MKKNIIFLVLGIIIAGGIAVCAQGVESLFAEPVYWDVVVNGNKKEIADQIVIINDRVYLPIRSIAEALEANISWIEGGDKIVITTSNYEDRNLYLYKEDDLYGYKDCQGNIMIPAQFSYADDFSEGIAAASSTFTEISDEYKEHGKVGYINDKGEFVISEQYDAAYGFCNGIALVSDGSTHNETYYYIDRKGEELFGQRFGLARSFSEGFAVVLKEGPGGSSLSPESEYLRKYAYIDTTGACVNDMVFQEARSFNNGYAVVKNQDKWGVIDNNFNVVIDYQYETEKDLQKYVDDLLNKTN